MCDSTGHRILHVVPSYWPATFWGGPIYSTKAICDGISRQPGFDVSVLTTDAAGLNVACRVKMNDPMDYPVTRTRRVAGHSIAPGLVARLTGAIRRADIVHLTGTYSFPTPWTLWLTSLQDKPIVWSLRGAVQATEEWPDSPNRVVKRHFEDITRYLAPARTVLHVTSRKEQETSSRRLPGLPAEIIPNSVEIPKYFAAREWRPGGRLRLLFLSRLHEKKGIDLLIDAVLDMPREVELTICGQGAPEYEAALKARTLGDPRIRFLGETIGEAKTEAFRDADLFVLPSHSENFGIVVAEALAHGVPVLTTNRTPWMELDTRGAGRCIDLSDSALRKAIAELANRPLQEMGTRGRVWMIASFSPDAVTERFVDLYSSLLTETANS